jgi:hypothetical protein
VSLQQGIDPLNHAAGMVPDAVKTIQATMDRNKARGVQVVATTMLNAAAAAIMRGVRRVCK